MKKLVDDFEMQTNSEFRSWIFYTEHSIGLKRRWLGILGREKQHFIELLLSL